MRAARVKDRLTALNAQATRRMPLPLAALLMKIEMADQFVFHSHVADDRGCAIEAQERIATVRKRLREQLRKGLAEIVAATERGCGCGTGFSDADAAEMIIVWDERLREQLSDTLDDLRDRAGGEE